MANNRLYVPTGPIGFENEAKDVVLSPNATHRPERIVIGSVEVGNSSGSDAFMGWGYKMPNTSWAAGQWDDSANASYTADTTDAQDAGANDFALTTTTNDDGFILECDEPFHVIGITVGTAEGGSPAYAYEYWDGSSWANLEPFMLYTPDFTGTGDTYFGWLQPHDWTALATGDTPVDTDGLTAGRYAIKLDASTAPSTAPLANVLWVVRLCDYVEAVGDGKSITLTASGEIQIPYQAGVVPITETADSGNWCSIRYRMGG
jgi:hypothetical protein